LSIEADVTLMRHMKLLTLEASNRSGFSRLLLDSWWRRNRLLILCYHGISLEDEHLWNPSLFMSSEKFRSRLEHLRDSGCSVLPLEEALLRLRAGDLPPRSVTLTFDDGNYDFYRVAAPLLREFGFPVTLYLTTYYSEFNRPVFDVACSYILWKARRSKVDWPEVFGSPLKLNAAGRAEAERRLKQFAKAERMSGPQKDELLAELSGKLGFDYAAFLRKRILHLVTPEEAAELAASGVDIQLHTHRHRTSTERDLFLREIDDNRQRISRITGEGTSHFCYPGGFHLDQYPEWLRERGVRSATTCEVGLAACDSDPLLLPRLVDHSGLTSGEFYAWISGVAALLPRRRHIMSDGQLLEAIA
jgi:peptidoglycan/xylan/chitin deacetylase (PgdA/CDA1 family)